MTLSELLHSVSFEEIVPYIGKYQGNEKNIAWYKMHYDLLCQTKPFSGEDDIKSATISYYDDEEDNSLGRLKAYPLEGDYWNVSLAKELIINPEVDASKEEIAACCLWHTSFWGFTKEQRIEIFESWHEDITKAKVKKYKRIYGSELPDKKQMLEKRAFHNYIKREMKIHRNYRSSHFSKEDKRLLGCIKRKWRMWKRWEINNRYNEAVIGRSEYFHKIIESGEEIHPPRSCLFKDTLYIFAGRALQYMQFSNICHRFIIAS